MLPTKPCSSFELSSTRPARAISRDATRMLSKCSKSYGWQRGSTSRKGKLKLVRILRRACLKVRPRLACAEENCKCLKSSSPR